MFHESGSYLARDLLNVPISDFLPFDYIRKITVICDDGELNCSMREMVLTRFAWEIYAEFPMITVLKRHHLADKTGTYKGSSIGEILNNILWDCTDICLENGIRRIRGFDPENDRLDYDIYRGIDHPDQFFTAANRAKWDIDKILPYLDYVGNMGGINASELVGQSFFVLTTLCQRCYEISDTIHHYYRDLPSEVLSINILDYIELQTHEDIAGAMRGLQKKEAEGEVVQAKDIKNTYEIINKVLKKDVRYCANVLTMASNCEAIKIGQLYKNIGPYGIVTDVDSLVFNNCVILDSFVTGLTKIEYLIVESRTAAMSIFYQSEAMKKSEYLTRQLQLIGACIWRVHHGVDCGSKNYAPMPIAIDTHLRDYVGMWYLDEETGTEKMVKKNDRQLLGRIVNFRTVQGCALTDRYGFCEKCYGQLAESLMPGDSVGHFAATDMQEKITQRILSNKHLVGSATVEDFVFAGTDRELLINKSNTTAFFINPNLKNASRFQIVFAEEDASKLQEIDHIHDLKLSSPARLSRLTQVKFQIFRDDVMIMDYVVNTSTESRKAYFTLEMLEYIKLYRWKFDHNGNYIVDMSKWDIGKPFMDMPLIQYSTPAHMMAVRSFFISGEATGKEALVSYPTPMAGLIALHDLVRSNVEVNLAHLQTLVLAMTIEDDKTLDYRPPKIKSRGKLANYNDIMMRRDSSLAMAYEDHYLAFFSNINTYLVPHRSPHPFNRLLAG